MKKYLLMVILWPVMSFSALAQAPVASFTISDTSGCSPIVVQFTDQSSNNPTSWSWDLGNGGSSTLQNPSATYITPGTYTIILTATNANGSSKDTGYVTVYASPNVAFTADSTPACSTKTVQFTNQTTAGAPGAISYIWDFGDGSSSSATSPTHTYASPGTYTVSLVATNSNGCTKTLTKNNFITIYADPTASFSASQTTKCIAPFTVNFSNSSTGAATYNWNFGDGNSSSATSPSHTYTSSGSYTVTLIATSANGCKDTLTRTNYINVGSVNASFTFNTPICAGQQVQFTNTTTPGSGNSNWTFGDGGSSTATSPVHTYSTAGTYTVTLIENYSTCSDTSQQTVTVNASPASQFSANNTTSCSIPFNVSFTNSSTGATSYSWLFGDGSSSTATSPSHTYTTYGNFNVRLISTNGAGCKDTLTKNNYIKTTPLNVTLTAEPESGCVGPVFFKATNTTSFNITSYFWNFGDGNTTSCSSCDTITHNYTSTGTYNAYVVVQSGSSCTDTVFKTITISSKPTASFTGSPLSICPNGNVSFTNSSTGANSYIWNFGNGRSSTLTSPTNTYSFTGLYTVSLVANNNGCSDTLTRANYVEVQLPRARFVPSKTCNNILAYTFLDSSLGADTYSWTFGDGNSSTNSGNTSHTYATPGTYIVTLTVTNTSTSCNSIYRDTITIIDKSAIDFTADDTVICDDVVKFVRSSPNSGYDYFWNFGFGNNVGNNGNVLFRTFPDPGFYTIKLIYRDEFNCIDSIVKPNYIQKGGTDVQFTSDDTVACGNDRILFTDTSTSLFGKANRVWYFGDGTSANVSTDTVSHTYSATGNYNVSLVITDSLGCVDTLTKVSYISKFPLAAGTSASDTALCVGDTLTFYNTSTGTNTIPTWYYGDGNSASFVSPQDSVRYAYSTKGLFTVKLVITDQYGCKDSVIKPDYIETEQPNASFTMSDSVGACPPLTVNFANTTPGAATQSWTFGNNKQSSLANPSTTYTFPAVYTVTLTTSDNNGCTATATDTVTVNGPTGTYSYTPTSGCAPVTVSFTASANNTTSYIWDLNNGVTQTTSSNTLTYTYTQPGWYVPKLILSDGASCQIPIENNDTVTVGGVSADFTFTARGNYCNTDTIDFNDTLYSLVGTVTSRFWDFGDGNTTTGADPSHYYSAPGSYTVKLIITTSNSCKDTIIKTVEINQLPNVVATAANDSLCPGTGGTQLTATGADTFTWTPATGLSCTNCSNPVANPATTTTYIVTGTDTNGCSNMDTVTITINPKPSVSSGTDKTICTGSSAQLQATGATSYNWSPATGLSCVNCAAPTATPATTTTYTVIGQNIYGCSDTDDVKVTVVTKPNVSAGSNKTICSGDSVLLVANGASSYTWSPGGTLSCTNCDSTYASPTSTTTYTVIGTLGNGCTDTTTVTVNVNALPNVNGGADKNICVGDSVQLQVTGAATYTWTPATGLSCTSCPNPKASPATTTTYTITGTDNNGCKNTDQVKVTVNALPNVNAGNDQSVCLNDSVQLQATGAATYTWTPVTGLSCTSCPNPKASPATTTTYTVTGTNSNGCVNTDDIEVTVKALPTVSAGNDQTICLNDSAQLQASGASTYTWTPANGLGCTNCADPKASPAVTTTYIVTGTATNSCTDKDTVVVNVNPLPTISAGPDTSVCLNDSVQLQASGGNTYIWAPATGLSCTNCDNPKASPPVTTTYTVEGTDINGCKNTDQITVTVKALPTVIATAARDTICAGDTTLLQATGAATYTWFPNGTGASITVNPSTNSTYIVTGTDNQGCSARDTVSVATKAAPPVNAGPNQEYCIGGSATLIATGAASYVWTPSANLSCTNCDTTIANPTTTTTYTVEGTDNQGCKASSTVTVTVNPLPNISAGDDVDLCDGDSVQLNATGGVNYTWTPSTGLSCTNCVNPKSGVSDNITYTVTGTDANGCTNNDDLTVRVIKKQEISFSAADSICAGDTVTLTASGGTQYTWLPSGSADPSIIVTPQSTTDYRIIIKQGTCFVDTGIVTVTVFPVPTVNAGEDRTVSGGSKVTLRANGTSGVSYQWTPGINLSCTDCETTTAEVGSTTTFTVRVTTPFGCTAQDDVTISTTCGSEQIFVANTFTPNGDGFNDMFYPQGRGDIQVLQFSIYNRWGQLVFDTRNISLNDPAAGWDGTFNKEPLQPDVFVYFIKAICEEGEAIDLKGDISLVR